jgi:hypothetical protein
LERLWTLSWWSRFSIQIDPIHKHSLWFLIFSLSNMNC